MPLSLPNASQLDTGRAQNGGRVARYADRNTVYDDDSLGLIMGSTYPHGAPYPVGTDRVMDGDNAIAALAKWADDRATVQSAQPATRAYALKVYAVGMNFDNAGAGQCIWPDPKPVQATAVFFSSNHPSDKSLRLWSAAPIGPTGFNNNECWLAGGPISSNIPMVLFLVVDQIG